MQKRQVGWLVEWGEVDGTGRAVYKAKLVSMRDSAIFKTFFSERGGLTPVYIDQPERRKGDRRQG